MLTVRECATAARARQRAWCAAMGCRKLRPSLNPTTSSSSLGAPERGWLTCHPHTRHRSFTNKLAAAATARVALPAAAVLAAVLLFMGCTLAAVAARRNAAATAAVDAATLAAVIRSIDVLASGLVRSQQRLAPHRWCGSSGDDVGTAPRDAPGDAAGAPDAQPGAFHAARAQGHDTGAALHDACTVPVVMYTWNRAAYVSRTLRRLRELAQHVAALPGWPADTPPLQIIVACDGPHAGVLSAITEAVNAGTPISRLLIRPVSHRPQERGGNALATLKAHWMWMLHNVFDVIPELQQLHGDVLFLEDDMEVSLDTLHVFRWLSAVRSARCHDCWGGAVSLYGMSTWDQASPAPPFTTAIIGTGHSNHGYFFNRTLWRAIHGVAEHLERYPDGWDWSFVHGMHMGALPPRMVYTPLSRVRNFGAEGITVQPDAYIDSGLGTTPVSNVTAAAFLAAAATGQLSVEEHPFVGHPSPPPDSVANTLGRCPVCAVKRAGEG
ncbi:hypothetical protein EON62_02755 [archaeon]|nr:MAG: hypothetical protein EON62_02755 [archaeon]